MDSLGGIYDSLADVERRSREEDVRFGFDAFKHSLIHDTVEEPEDVDMPDAHTLEHSQDERDGDICMAEPAEELEEIEMAESDSISHGIKDFLLNPTSLGAQMGRAAMVDKGMTTDTSQGIQTEPEEKPQLEEPEETRQREKRPDHKPPHEEETEEPKAKKMEVMPLPTPNWIATHNPNAPYVVSTYLQLAFNIVAVSAAVYLVSRSIVTFWRDVDYKLEEYSSHLLVDIQRCTREYLQNDCRPDIRPPALEDKCTEWEKCMSQDPSAVGRTKVTVETIAEIINVFLASFTYRAILTFFLIFASTMFVMNFAFGFFRARAYYGRRPSPTHEVDDSYGLSSGAQYRLTY
ncbi:hypothetical protein TRVA0_011S03114 [Trichomonascus vanleenenianus]|uniref:Brr6/Brl1 family protein n=1 Tax=Trichomonascus vanleenenianus TaxID=2268995 RepID=UPI003ECB4026